MTCTVDERVQVRRAAEAIRECEAAVSVDVLEPAASQYDAWTVAVGGRRIPMQFRDCLGDERGVERALVAVEVAMLDRRRILGRNVRVGIRAALE